MMQSNLIGDKTTFAIEYTFCDDSHDEEATAKLVETLQLPVRTTVVDSKTEKYVEVSASSTKPVKIGTWGDPVTDGTWIYGSDGKWMYRTNAYFRSTWGFIRNPYAKEGQEKDSWFWFDANGKMLTGWQFINNNWYYLSPVSDGTQGRCYLDTTTPDGYKVDKTEPGSSKRNKRSNRKNACCVSA